MKLRIISLIKFFIKFIFGNNVCALSLNVLTALQIMFLFKDCLDKLLFLSCQALTMWLTVDKKVKFLCWLLSAGFDSF